MREIPLLMRSVVSSVMILAISSTISRQLVMTQVPSARHASFATLQTAAPQCRQSLRCRTSRPAACLRSTSTRRCRSTTRPIWLITNSENSSTWTERLAFLAPRLLAVLLEAELDAYQDACWEISDHNEQVSSRLSSVFHMRDLLRENSPLRPIPSLHLPLEGLNDHAGEWSTPFTQPKRCTFDNTLNSTRFILFYIFPIFQLLNLTVVSAIREHQLSINITCARSNPPILLVYFISNQYIGTPISIPSLTFNLIFSKTLSLST